MEAIACRRSSVLGSMRTIVKMRSRRRWLPMAIALFTSPPDPGVTNLGVQVDVAGTAWDGDRQWRVRLVLRAASGFKGTDTFTVGITQSGGNKATGTALVTVSVTVE
jgi:hypothetical protein